jgi:protein Tex
MVLEGVVTNVAAFGAFVDVGVHQDGLVHISAMSNSFVRDPRAVAKPGDIVRVKVLEVDPKRRRISLTMRLDERPAPPRPPERNDREPPPKPRPQPPASGGAIAEALLRAGLTRGK